MVDVRIMVSQKEAEIIAHLQYTKMMENTSRWPRYEGFNPAPRPVWVRNRAAELVKLGANPGEITEEVREAFKNAKSDRT
jgi:hypothetical protein